PLFAAYFLVTWTTALIMLGLKWRRARGLTRLQLKYLSIGVFIFGLSGMTTNLILPLLTGRPTYAWAGPFFAVAFVVFMSHAILRHSLVDFRQVVLRMSAIAIATAASIAVAGLFVSILGSQVFSHLEPAELILVLSSTAVACMIVSLVRDFAGEKLD